jgi:hypothetical protein
MKAAVPVVENCIEKGLETHCRPDYSLRFAAFIMTRLLNVLIITGLAAVLRMTGSMLDKNILL